MKLVFATNNHHKLREINHILGNEFSLVTPAEVGITEDIPENEPTLEGNALSKARYIFQATGLDVFADDTGLETEALNGLPGVISARFAGEEKNSEANIAKLLEMLSGKENRRARFRTVIALITGKKEYLFEGIVNGVIIDERRGKEGFGYDPVFVPEDSLHTFAEMNLDEKSLVSHRARAFLKLKAFLSDYKKQQ